MDYKSDLLSIFISSTSKISVAPPDNKNEKKNISYLSIDIFFQNLDGAIFNGIFQPKLLQPTIFSKSFTLLQLEPSSKHF